MRCVHVIFAFSCVGQFDCTRTVTNWRIKIICLST